MITDLDLSLLDEELEKEFRSNGLIPEVPITEINTLGCGHFALGDKVYYIRPYNMCKIKCSTIKQFIWKCDDYDGYFIPDYDIVLDNGDVVRDIDLFRTLADVRAEVVKRLKSSIVNGYNSLAALQRKIAINERRLATLESYEEKIKNQSK